MVTLALFGQSFISPAIVFRGQIKPDDGREVSRLKDGEDEVIAQNGTNANAKKSSKVVRQSCAYYAHLANIK